LRKFGKLPQIPKITGIKWGMPPLRVQGRALAYLMSLLPIEW
jgi:hypothetical protein